MTRCHMEPYPLYVTSCHMSTTLLTYEQCCWINMFYFVPFPFKLYMTPMIHVARMNMQTPRMTVPG